MINASRLDPTRTTLLRKAFSREITRRFNLLKSAVDQLVIGEDALGLESSGFSTNPISSLSINAQWSFLPADRKLLAFRNWLDGVITDEILGSESRPWVEEYVRRAHIKGLTRSYQSVKKTIREESPLQSEFIERAIRNHAEALSLRIAQSQGRLRGVTDKMASKIGNVVADGLSNGSTPRQIAKGIREVVEASKTEALSYAKTDVVRQHAEGQLDAFEELGVDKIIVMVELVTAGDDKVCKICAAMEGVVLTVAKARGLIPLHNFCRCAFGPANIRKPRSTTRSGRRRILS